MTDYQKSVLEQDHFAIWDTARRERPAKFDALPDDQKPRAALCYYCGAMAVAEQPDELPPNWARRSVFVSNHRYTPICVCPHLHTDDLVRDNRRDPNFGRRDSEFYDLPVTSLFDDNPELRRLVEEYKLKIPQAAKVGRSGNPYFMADETAGPAHIIEIFDGDFVPKLADDDALIGVLSHEAGHGVAPHTHFPYKPAVLRDAKLPFNLNITGVCRSQPGPSEPTPPSANVGSGPIEPAPASDDVNS